MYKYLWLSTLIFLSCGHANNSAGSPSDSATETIPPADTMPSYTKLIWHDEFNYTGLPDTTKWTYDTGGSGFGNHELQYYTRDKKSNAWVSDGNLTITALKEDWKGKVYTSAKLRTKGKAAWKYGKIEIRAKIPKGRGTWPAIWMLSDHTPFKWPDDGEIDIMEHVGFDPGNIHGTVHTKSYNHILGTQKGDTIMVPDCMDQFHIYGIIWTPEKIDFFVDNHHYFTFHNEHKTKAEWPFDDKFYLILNIAIGGDWGGQKGVDNRIFPAKMEIDYVRVYQ